MPSVDYNSLLVESSNIAAEYEYGRQIADGQIDFKSGYNQVRPQKETVTRLAWVQVPRRHMPIPELHTLIMRTGDNKLADIVVNVVACNFIMACHRALSEMSHAYPEISSERWLYRAADRRDGVRCFFKLPERCEHGNAYEGQLSVCAENEAAALKQLQVVFPLADKTWLVKTCEDS